MFSLSYRISSQLIEYIFNYIIKENKKLEPYTFGIIYQVVQLFGLTNLCIFLKQKEEETSTTKFILQRKILLDFSEGFNQFCN